MTLLEVARIGRPHGVRGEVQVDLISDRAERLSSGASLVSDAGPLVVSAARPHGNRWIVRFEGIADRDAAERLRGLTLRAEADADVDGLWAHELIGLEVIDDTGRSHGRIDAILANPAHDQLVLTDGTLVPSVFIVSVDDAVFVDVPEGIFP